MEHVDSTKREGTIEDDEMLLDVVFRDVRLF